MNWNPPVDVSYGNNSFPYNSAENFINFFESLAYEHVNFIFSDALHVQGTYCIDLSSRLGFPHPMGQCWSNLCGSESGTDSEQNSQVQLANGNVHLITSTQNWQDKISESTRDCKIVVVNFSATWCSPCKVIAPAYRDLAEKYSSMIFVTVDVDELPEFSTSWDINATPTFFFLRDGRQIDKLVGANKQELQRKISAIADSTNKPK